MRYENQKELNAALRLWKKRLKLLDWDIEACFSHPKDMNGALGRININLMRKCAAIELDHKAPSYECDEHVLVHELLHCHFQPFSPTNDDSLEYEMWEQCVDQMATCFVSLARSSRPVAAA